MATTRSSEEVENKRKSILAQVQKLRSLQPLCTLLKNAFQITNVQRTLQEHYYRVEVLEKALAFKDMTNDERDKMEEELEAIKKLLACQEDALKQLQKQNRKTPMVAALFGLVCLATFLIYTVLVNPN